MGRHSDYGLLGGDITNCSAYYRKNLLAISSGAGETVVLGMARLDGLWKDQWTTFATKMTNL